MIGANRVSAGVYLTACATRNKSTTMGSRGTTIPTQRRGFTQCSNPMFPTTIRSRRLPFFVTLHCLPGVTITTSTMRTFIDPLYSETPLTTQRQSKATHLPGIGQPLPVTRAQSLPKERTQAVSLFHFRVKQKCRKTLHPAPQLKY